MADACLEGLELRKKQDQAVDTEEGVMAQMLSARQSADNVESVPTP